MTSNFIPNSFQTPNVYVDQYMAFLTPAEYKVLSYAVRRIFGFQKRQDNISMSQFCSGLCNRQGEQLDYGTGLGYGTVKNALDFLKKCKLVIQVAKNDDKLNIGACYALQLESDHVDWNIINKRVETIKKTNKKRTKNARKVASKKIKELANVDPLCGTEDLCGTEGTPPCGTEGTPPCGTEEQYTDEIKEKQIGAKNAPEHNPPIPDGYDVLFNEEGNEEQANAQRARTQAALMRGAQAQADNGAVDLSWLQEYLRPLAQAFVDAAGENHEPIKADYSLWRKTLSTWFALKLVPQDITNAVQYMRDPDNALTIGGIQSVTKTARDRKGGQEEIISALPKITSETKFN